jgi:Ca2+/H+ antiporter, TMEM165/GDT1 family
MNPWVLATTTFAASAVEFVEAATIVMAVGVTQGWRAALGGTALASFALLVLVALGSPVLMNASSLDRLELIVGPFLVLFGIGWLRKAVWRYAGRKAMHDEDAIYAREVANLRDRDVRGGFAVAFGGVFVEGLEVAVIVVTFAASAPALVAWSAGGALAAFALVVAAALALRAPFSRVPENALKALVGVMLLALGTFWTGEGLHVVWWYGDATFATLALGAFALAALLTMMLRARAA